MVIVRNAAGQVIYEHPGDTLASAFLANQYLRNAQLAGHDLSGADLRDARLVEANLEGVDLTGALLDDADLSRAKLQSATLDGASFYRTRLAEADLTQVHARQAQFSAATLDDVQAHQADFSGSVFENASMKRMRAQGAVFRECQLIAADMESGFFAGADFTAARLRNPNLEHANLVGCCLQQATLWCPRLYAANVAGVNFSSAADLIGCRGKGGDGQVCLWPPHEFDSRDAGPVFDPTTVWPQHISFPRRKFHWKYVVWIGGSVGSGVGFCTLFAWPGSVSWRSWWGALYGTLLMAGLHGWRVWKTNREIAQEPYRWFDAGLGERRMRVNPP